MAAFGEIPGEHSVLPELHPFEERLQASSDDAPAETVTAINDAATPEPAAANTPAAEPPAESTTARNTTNPADPATTTLDAVDKLARCEERLHYVFQNKALLRAALTHASSAEHRGASNERLEFLGDAILGMITCEMLYRKYPEFLEGDLTRVKSVVVSRHTCAKLSRLMRLDEFMFVGKGMTLSGGVPQSVMADVFEALIAAIYLDGGEPHAREFVKKYVSPEIALAVSGQTGDNYKSLLQQVSQRRFGATPLYQLLDERGPDHNKCFKVAALAGTRSFPPAWGNNKKDAEQRAACNALSDLNGEAPPFPAEDDAAPPQI